MADATLTQDFIEWAGSVWDFLFDSYLASLDMYLENMFSVLTPEFLFWARIVSILYIMTAAYMWGIGRGGKDLALSIGFVAFLSSICFVPSIFGEWIFSPIREFVIVVPGKVLSLALNGKIDSTDGAFKALGDMYAKIAEFGIQLDAKYESVSWKDIAGRFKIMFAELILNIAFTIPALIYLYYTIFATAAVFVFTTIGPICIFLGSFKFSRHICFAWIRSIANYCMIPFFASILLSLSIGIISKQIDNMIQQSSPTVFSTNFLVCILLCILNAALLLNAPTLAANLTGARAGSTAGIAAGVGSFGGAVMGAGAMTSKGYGHSALFAGGMATWGAKKGWDMWQQHKQNIQGRP